MNLSDGLVTDSDHSYFDQFDPKTASDSTSKEALYMPDGVWIDHCRFSDGTCTDGQKLRHRQRRAEKDRPQEL